MFVFITESFREEKKTKLVKRLIMSKYPNKRKFQNLGFKESCVLS